MEQFYAMQKFGFNPPLPDFVVEWTSRAKAQTTEMKTTKQAEGEVKKTSSTTELAITGHKRKRKVAANLSGSTKRVMLKRKVQLVVKCKEKTDHPINAGRKLCRFPSTKRYKIGKKNKPVVNCANFKHIVTTQSQEQKFECADCKYKTKWKGCLDLHILTHGSVKSHACAHCTYTTMHKGSMRMHMHTHTGEKPYKCHLCGFKCTQKGNLAGHVRNMHTKDTLKLQVLRDQPDEFDPINSLAQDHHIKVAKNMGYGDSSNSMDISSNTEHIMASHTNMKKIKSSNSMENIKTIKHIEAIHTHEGKIECSNSMNNSGNNIKSMAEHHTNEKKIECNKPMHNTNSDTIKQIVATHSDKGEIECRNSIKNSDTFKHIAATNNNEKKIERYKSVDNSDSITHTVKTHSPERKFQCNDCEYKAKRKGSLELHILTHGGVKPFACALCNFRGMHKGSLRTHMRKHTGEKPYKCHLCGFKCTQNGNLASHVRHMHTQERPFSCTQCGYTCKRRSHLDRHMMRHEGGNRRYRFMCKDTQQSRGHLLRCRETEKKLSSRSAAQLNEKFACLHLHCEFRCKQPGHMWKHIAAKHAG